MKVRNESRDEQLPQAWGVGLETVALAAGAVLLGMVIQPEDPFFTRNTFAWLALGPLLAGLRYGFTSGFFCALLLVMMLFGHQQAGWAPVIEFPTQLAFGVVVVGAVSGEFRDIWERKLVRGALQGDWHKQRLDEFSRVYHLLRVSHEHLERRLARGAGSLRHALTELKAKAVHTEVGESRLQQLGDDVLQICATYCGVQTAALYGMDGMGTLDGRPLARLGEAGPLDTEDALLRQALSSGEVVTLKDHPGRGGLVAAIPLRDVRDRVHGVIVVSRMHFQSIQADTFRTLAVLGAHVGDLLAGSPGPRVRQGASFLQALQASLRDLQRYATPVSLVAITSHEDRGVPGLEMLAVQKRGLDEQWLTRNDRDEQVLVMLLPLTDETGASGCKARLEQLLRSVHHEGAHSNPYTFQVETLGVKDQAQQVLGRVLGRIHVENIHVPGRVGPASRSNELGVTPRV